MKAAIVNQMSELARGNLRNRRQILAHLNGLPRAVSATHEEVLKLVEDRRIRGFGIGWIDAHLLVSALLSNCRLWTSDRELDRPSGRAGVKLHRYT